MKYPNFNEEDHLLKRGVSIIAGIDEVGRGPLAGPVVASAVVIKKRGSLLEYNIKDSKKLSAKKRLEIFNLLTNNNEIEWGIGIVSEKIIDKINILEATKLAMKKAVSNLEEKIMRKIEFLLLDGNFTIDIDLSQKAIIGGDDKVFSISVASIIAKVIRDSIMIKYHGQYPLYGFDKHKGYGTKLHFEMLKKHGFCKIHRKTFKPVSTLIQQS